MIDLKLFDDWNAVKKQTQSTNKVEYFRERQIWWCIIGQNIGYEVYGKGKFFTRPVLIYKKLTHDTFIGIPLTSKNKVGSWFVAFKHKDVDENAMLHQVRIFDKKRLKKLFGEVDELDFERIKKSFLNLYG